MKKLILTLGLVVAVVLISTAQSNDAMQKEITTEQQDPKTIKFEETPSAVQEAFKNSEYKKESIKKVHEISEGMKTFYKIVVDVNDKKWALKYDEQGNLLETKEDK